MASKYLQKYPVPEGFSNILADFASEVLRDQPENIYDFGYQYFKAIEEVSLLFVTESSKWESEVKCTFICIACNLWMLTIYICLKGVEFDYANKGAAIPPPKDRQADASGYNVVEPSPDAHVIQDAPEQYNQ